MLGLRTRYGLMFVLLAAALTATAQEPAPELSPEACSPPCGGQPLAPDRHGHAKWWLDPAVKHTNGMRVAVSEPHRAASVCWACSPNQRGQCADQYNGFCWNPFANTAAAATATKCDCGDSAACACCPACQRLHWQGPTVACDAVGIEGIEAPGDAMLGQIPASGPVTGRGQASPLGAPPAGLPFALPGGLQGLMPAQ